MGHRAAAAGFAASFMLAFVAKRLIHDPGLIALAVTFVFCNLVNSLFEFATTADPSHLAPATFEAIFLTIYAVFIAVNYRADRTKSPAQ